MSRRHIGDLFTGRKFRRMAIRFKQERINNHAGFKWASVTDVLTYLEQRANDGLMSYFWHSDQTLVVVNTMDERGKHVMHQTGSRQHNRTVGGTFDRRTNRRAGYPRLRKGW